MNAARVREKIEALTLQEGECLLYMGPKKLGICGHRTSARAWVYWLEHGEFPVNAVTATCGNGRCVEPKHFGSRPRPTMTPEDRIWARIQKTPDCWIWTGRMCSAGPRVRVDGKELMVVRWLWDGEAPPVLIATCSNPRCVNPAHYERKGTGLDWNARRDFINKMKSWQKGKLSVAWQRVDRAKEHWRLEGKEGVRLRRKYKKRGLAKCCNGRQCIRPSHWGTRQEANIAKFWRYVDKSGDCWMWTGTIGQHGYGHMYDVLVLKGKKQGARLEMHRFAYEQFVGEIPAGMLVRHRCNVAACVNPDHLEIGTHADNMRDLRDAGYMGDRIRQAIDSRGYRNMDTREVVSAYMEHGSYSKAAKHLKCHPGTVRVHVAKWNGGRGLSPTEERILMDKYGNKCAHCGGNGPLEIDHVIPVSSNGSGRVQNFQPLCKSCNAKKGGAVYYGPLTPLQEYRAT